MWGGEVGGGREKDGRMERRYGVEGEQRGGDVENMGVKTIS